MFNSSPLNIRPKGRGASVPPSVGGGSVMVSTAACDAVRRGSIPRRHTNIDGRSAQRSVRRGPMLRVGRRRIHTQISKRLGCFNIPADGFATIWVCVRRRKPNVRRTRRPVSRYYRELESLSRTPFMGTWCKVSTPSNWRSRTRFNSGRPCLQEGRPLASEVKRGVRIHAYPTLRVKPRRSRSR